MAPSAKESGRLKATGGSDDLRPEQHLRQDRARARRRRSRSTKTNDTIAFMDIMPQADGHVLVIPKEGGENHLRHLRRRRPPP